MKRFPTFVAVLVLSILMAFGPLIDAWRSLRVKWLWGSKDGGADSNVRVWGLEVKGLFSVLVLCFGQGSREAFHSHAFNCVSWVLSGALWECVRTAADPLGAAFGSWNGYVAGIRPVITKRSTFHQVHGRDSANWVLTFRGPWASTWRDSSAAGDVMLTHGRQVVS